MLPASGLAAARLGPHLRITGEHGDVRPAGALEHAGRRHGAQPMHAMGDDRPGGDLLDLLRQRAELDL
jgi:hypothetical protein